MNEEFDFTCLNELTSDEIISLLKSNRISWRTRKLIRVSFAGKIIEEYSLIIIAVGIAHITLEMMRDSLEEKNIIKDKEDKQ